MRFVGQGNGESSVEYLRMISIKENFYCLVNWHNVYSQWSHITGLYIYKIILLTRCEIHTGIVWTEPTEKRVRANVFSLHKLGFKIRDLLHNRKYQKTFNSDLAGSFGRVPSPIIRAYRTSNGAI